MLSYQDARENRDPSKEGARHRHKQYVKAAGYYAKALSLDPQCAFAAQGLAIGIAENTLGTGINHAADGSVPLSSSQVMQKNTRDALTILSKVKESVNEGSVYINIGHCHFLREEYDRAIENVSLEMRCAAEAGSYASRAVRNCISPLLSHQERVHTPLPLTSMVPQGKQRAELCRSAKSSRVVQDGTPLAGAALTCSQADPIRGPQAFDLQPGDLATRWNMALVQQKGIEILLALPESKRTVAEFTIALADAEASQA